MGFATLFEIGFFEAFWNFSNWILTLLVYLCLLIGFVIQSVLFKKCRTWSMRFSFPITCVLGIVISECAYHAITGWDSLSVLFIYGFLCCCLFGAALAAGIRFISKRKAQ